MLENQYIEWKESWRDEYLKWICGFANAQGGLLIIGKNDLGEIINVPDAENLAVEIPNKVRDLLGIMVDVNLLEENDKKYLEIVIDPYPYPVNYKGQYHYRSGSTKQELKGNVLNKFILQKTGKHWDSVPMPHLNLQEMSVTAFELFRKKAARSKRVEEEILNENNEMLLEHLHLTDNYQFKRASALLFHQNPEKFFTGAYVKIGFFENDADLLYHDEIHGNLFEQADKTMDLLLTKYMKIKIRYEGITRVETYPYPEAALREAVINAIVHKEYSTGIPIQIKVYENKLSIWNDGQLPIDWTLGKLLSAHPSKPNNPDVANVFFRAGMIEAWGRGIDKIIKMCLSDGLQEPVFDIGFGGLQINFIANIDDVEKSTVKSTVKSIEKSIEESIEESIVKSTEKTTEKMLILMRNNQEITIEQLALELNLTPGAINKQIAKLKSKNKIKRIGPKKGGYWRILD